MAEERVERRLLAILAADVVGYSRLMGEDEEGTHAAMKAIQGELGDPKDRGAPRAHRQENWRRAACRIAERRRCGAVRRRDAARDGDAQRGDPGREARRVSHRASTSAISSSTSTTSTATASMSRRGSKLWPIRAGSASAGLCVTRCATSSMSPSRIWASSRSRTSRGQCASTVLRSPRTLAAKAPLPLPEKPSLAVLPFQNMSGDPEQEYFADGIVEDITTAISRLPWLFVIARNSSFTYKGRPVDVKQVARELGVRYVLEGSVRKAGNRVRIGGQLIDTTSGAHIWADRFDGELDDIFALQDQVASSVVGAIEPRLRHSEIERATRKPTESLDAYDLYLRALAQVHKYSEEGIARGYHLARSERLQSIRAYAPAAAMIGVLPSPIRRARGVGDRSRTRRSQKGCTWRDRRSRLARTIPTFCGWPATPFQSSLASTLRRLAPSTVRSKLNPNSAHAWMARGWVAGYQNQPTCSDRGARASDPTEPARSARLYVFVAGSLSPILPQARYEEALSGRTVRCANSRAYTDQRQGGLVRPSRPNRRSGAIG